MLKNKIDYWFNSYQIVWGAHVKHFIKHISKSSYTENIDIEPCSLVLITVININGNEQ